MFRIIIRLNQNVDEASSHVDVSMRCAFYIYVTAVFSTIIIDGKHADIPYWFGLK